ncbi:hypothetical protein BGZ58_011084 [Dissophora ornata]|nr:hypothetical protein BGZ58_011084 [Dissophora ornata]
MFEMQRAPTLGPSTNRRLTLPRIDGPEEELEVIGSGIRGSFEPHSTKGRLPMKLPNLKYDYPEASEQNFSPGTSLIFNAYRGHRGLLTQPYMAMIEGPDSYAEQRLQRPQHQLSYQHHHSEDYAPHRQQRPLEHPSFRPSHERQFHQSQGNRDSTDYRDHRDSRDPQEYRDPREHDSGSHLRSPGMTPSSSLPMPGVADPSPQRVEQNHGPYRPRDNYPPSQPPPPPPPKSAPLDAGYKVSPSMPQQWSNPDADPSMAHRSYGGSGSSSRVHPPQPQPAQRQTEDLWENPDRRQAFPTAAIDIPQPRHPGPPGYSPEDGGMRSQSYQSYSQYSESRMPSESVESSSRGPFNPRAHGPRYELTRIQYRMIFDYASEIRECLIKGKIGSTDRLLYSAEILSKVFMGCRRDIDPNALAEEETDINPHQLRCTSCNSVKTPEWRKGPLVWGKMSRSKAKELAKRKEESGVKSEAPAETSATGDKHMADVHEDVEQLIELAAPIALDGSRKRGRDISAPDADDADDVEVSARNEDMKAIAESWQEAGTPPHLAGTSQPGSDQDEDLGHDGMQLPGKSETSVDHSHQTSTSRDSTGQNGQEVSPGTAPSPSLIPDTRMNGGQNNHSLDDPSAGRKLALSFLLG